LLLLHDPNGDASVNVVVEDTHTFVVPLIAAGNGLTVNTDVVVQPVTGNVYIIVEVPAATPVTTPVPETTVATDDVLLVQAPPPASLSADVAPMQADNVPVIADGNGLTVTGAVIKHPVDVSV